MRHGASMLVIGLASRQTFRVRNRVCKEQRHGHPGLTNTACETKLTSTIICRLGGPGPSPWPAASGGFAPTKGNSDSCILSVKMAQGRSR